MNRTSPQDATQQPIGVIVFGRKRPGFDQAWSAEVRTRCRQMLDGLGYRTIGADRVVMDDAGVGSLLDEIDAAGCRALIVIQPSLADGQYALAVSQRWAGPVILWATPERPGDGKVSSCSLVGQNLWASILRQAGHPFEFVYAGPAAEGGPDATREALALAVRLSTTVHALRTAKLGMIGTHAPGFLDLAADPFLLRKTFGIQLQALSLPQFIERVQAIPTAAVAADLARIRKLGLPGTAGSGAVLSDDLLGINARFYLAIEEILREANLDALALQCWPELPNTLGQWPYFAVSRLSAEGHAIAIEGDVDGAVGALIGRFMGIGPGFLTDWLEHDDTTIFFWHPGMAPLDMCNEAGCADEPSVGTHFNGERPFVIDGALRVGSDVTVSRVWRCDGRYHMTAFEGKAIPPRRRVTGNSVLVEVDGGAVPERFDRLIHQGLPHHVTLHFGRHRSALCKLARLLGVVWHA